MENISEKTLYANIKNNGQREIHEVRFVEFRERPCYFYFNGQTKRLAFLFGCSLDIELEIAGMGVYTGHQFHNSLDGRLYTTMAQARIGNAEQSLYKHEWGNDSLIMDWANIYYGDLNLRHPFTTLEKDFDNHRQRGYFKLEPYSYSWDGTCSQRHHIVWKFKIDLIGNKLELFKDRNEDKLGTLYATWEMCENANKPTVVTFDKPKQQVERIVSFELTMSVKVNVECDDEDTIAAAMEKIRTCDDEVLFGACVSCTEQSQGLVRTCVLR